MALELFKARAELSAMRTRAEKAEADLNASRSAGRREGLEEALEVLRKLACSYLPEDRGLVLSEELGIHVYSPAAHLRIQLAAIRALASAQPRAERRGCQLDIWLVREPGTSHGTMHSTFDRRQPRAKAAEQDCPYCCNGDRCDNPAHFLRQDCPYRHGTGKLSAIDFPGVHPRCTFPGCACNHGQCVAEQEAAPADWVRAPMEPTNVMIAAGNTAYWLLADKTAGDDRCRYGDTYAHDIYCAMLAALPSLPAGQGERG